MLGHLDLYNYTNRLILLQKKIDVVFLNPSIEGVNITENFLDVLRAIDLFDRNIKGLPIAKSKGRIGGRPRIPNDEKDRIFLKDFEILWLKNCQS